MISDPNPEIGPWSFDGGPKLPTHYLTPAEQKRTGHLFKGCPNPVEQKTDRKADGCVPCSVCLLVKAAVDAEVQTWRAIQEAKAQTWRGGVTSSIKVQPEDHDEDEADDLDYYIPPAPDVISLMATEKQVALLVKLATEKTPEWVNKIGLEAVTRRAQERTKSQASAAIDKLMAMPTVGNHKQMKRGAVKAGFYAIPTVEGARNALAFYRVDVPTEGKWAGYTFVKLIIGGQEPTRVPKAQATGILARIAADPDAGPRYGQEIGKCCRCNRTLTNDESRAAGIGPECASKGM